MTQTYLSTEIAHSKERPATGDSLPLQTHNTVTVHYECYLSKSCPCTLLPLPMPRAPRYASGHSVKPVEVTRADMRRDKVNKLAGESDSAESTCVRPDGSVVGR